MFDRFWYFEGAQWIYVVDWFLSGANGWVFLSLSLFSLQQQDLSIRSQKQNNCSENLILPECQVSVLLHFTLKFSAMMLKIAVADEQSI